MLESVERQIERYIAQLDDKETAALYAKLPKGKRLRAKLVLQIAGNTPSAIKTAAVIEMIHAASLLHDDVIDDASMRRNKPSLNALYGNKTAIMLGDILYSKGFFELVSISKEVAGFVSHAVTQLSLGELADVRLSKRFHTDTKRYLQMVYQKTASLIEASAASAAFLENKPIEPYRIYGKNIGIAFQIVDDILDIVSDTQTLGKPAMHDLQEGKTTLPYIYLYEALDEEGREKLISMHAKTLDDTQQAWIRTQMQETQALQKAYLYAKELIDEAAELMEEQGEERLVALASDMIDREF